MIELILRSIILWRNIKIAQKTQIKIILKIVSDLFNYLFYSLYDKFNKKYLNYYHNNIWLGFYKYFWILLSHWDARAPSTTLWSAETINWHIDATLNYYHNYLYGLSGFDEVPSKIICLLVCPTPKIVDWGGFITDMTESIPNIPKLLIVVVPPIY